MLAVENIDVFYGDAQALDGVSLEVAEGAIVEAGAYVGPYARVLSGTMRGTARLEDHAVLDGGQLLGNARAGALSVIRADTILKDDAHVATTFQGIGESRYGADAGASASLSLTNTARVYVNYDAKFRAAMQSHQGTVGLELKW